MQTNRGLNVSTCVERIPPKGGDPSLPVTSHVCALVAPLNYSWKNQTPLHMHSLCGCRNDSGEENKSYWGNEIHVVTRDQQSFEGKSYHLF